MTTTLYSIIVEFVQIAVVLLAGPALAGWVRMLKCRMQGRTSAGVLQPYRDIMKLFVKDVVLAENASWIFRFTPYLVFGATVMAGAIIPVISTVLPSAPAADIIALVAIFAMARFFTALAGMDAGTAFGGMGSSREMTVATLAEPAMLMSVFTVSLVSGSTSLSQMAQVVTTNPLMLRPSLAFALLAFILIAVAETGRIPVDNPATHLELTMLHEAMTLEYSGRHLALIEWAKMIKLFLYAALGVALFFPWGIAGATPLWMLPAAVFYLAVKMAIVGAVIVLIETPLAKMRIFRVTEFLGMAFLFATIGMLSYFMLE
ncbi:MAG: NADH-quinone oxidoreductase subunit H [Deltaproteobacteria bacterium]|nr:NADH-quinone oxidoreductase subunit H [Deltaproteobacteria bacterium]